MSIKTYDQYLLNENVMSIKDLSDMSARLGVDHEGITELIQRAFRNNGDEGVIEVFKEITGLDIEALSRGRYVFKYFN